jgi:hypothetical protein
VTIRALKCGLLIGNTGIPFLDLGRQYMLPLVILLRRVACLAREDRYISILHRPDILVLSYSQVTSRAVFFDVARALMIKLYGISLNDLFLQVRRRKFMAGVTSLFILWQILKLIMAIKARLMPVRRVFEEFGGNRLGECVRSRF